jgi:signal transduction histidine kinase/CheY-like chemotaxis protein
MLMVDVGRLPDGGEMQRRRDDLDWSSTPLGPTEAWPSALRMAVETCLSSRFPMLVCWGPQLAMIYNDAYQPILGGTKHPGALGRPIKQVWAEVWGIVGPMLESVLSGGEPTWFEDQMLVIDRNGFLEECYFTYSFSPIRDDSGAVGGVLCVVSETTERVLGERRLATLTGLSTGLGGVEDVDAVRSVVATVLHRNGLDHPFAAVVMRPGPGTGPASEPVTVSADSLDLLDTPPQLRTDVAELAEEALRTGKLVRRNVAAAPWVLGEDAYTSPVGALCAIPVWLPGQETPEAALVIGRSAHRPWDGSLEAYLNLCTIQLRSAFVALRTRELQQRRAEALAALDEAKSAFFTNISHELRTPLTLISGAAQQTLSDQDVSDRQRSRLEIIDRNATRLTRMVDAMLDFDRMEAGRLSPILTELDVVEMTRGLAAAFLPAMERAGLHLDVDCEPQSRQALLDRDMYERIVLNLLMNAVKYTPVGRVSVRLRGDDDGFTISVSDTGIGIPRVDLDRIFERFEQLPRRSQARSHEGAGIGLAMVKQLTEIMGGRVSARSQLGIGSQFEVSLPWQAPHRPGPSRSVTPRHVEAFLTEADGWEVADRREPAGSSGEGTDVAPKGTLPRVVVADDNADMRAYLRDLLSTRYDVELAPDGEAALEAIRARRPDLVLADAMMPRLDGFELVRAIREDASLSDLPIVLLSARAEERDTTLGLESGADDYIVKPFSVEELKARLASNLERSRARLRDAAWRRAVMASYTHPLVIAEADGRVIEFNEAFTELLGWELDEGPFDWPYPWWPADAEHPGAGEPSLPAEGEGAPSGSVEQQVRLVTKEGRDVWVATRRQRIDGVGDGGVLVVVTLRDVTREHRARERRRAAALLSAEFSASSDLAQVLATAVTGFAELFDGDSTVRAFAGDEEHLFTAHGPVLHGDIEATVREALDADSPDAPSLVSPVTGFLLVPDNPTSECRVWIQFRRPRLVTPDELIVGDLLAQAFALAVDRVVAAGDFAEREEHLSRAIESHRLIGQAIGILIERHRVSPTQAFGMLKQASQDRNIKLREIAARVIETGAEPTDAE